MNKLIVSILVLFLSANLMADDSMNHTMTPKHLYIKGTKISLIPPKDFIPSSNFQGLEQSESNSSIMVVEIPGDFSEIAKGISKESLLQNGVNAEKIEPVTFNHLSGIFVTGTQNSNGIDFTKYILIFGSEKETIILTGVFPKNYIKAGEEIKKSILSAHYNSMQIINAFDVLNYSLEVDSSQLKFAKFFSNSLIYTSDGLLPTLSKDKTSLIISKSISKITTEDKEQFTLYRLGQLPYEIKNIVSKIPITIANLPGFEIIAIGINKSTQEEEHLYQTILFDNDSYYIFFGTTSDTTGIKTNEIKKAVKTFQLKK